MKNVLPFVGALFLFQISCVNDPQTEGPTFDGDQLHGRWELVEAYRNGRKTETLTDAFYVFESNGDLSTNFPPSVNGQSLTYDFNGQKIKTKGAEEMVFDVNELNDSTLTLSMIIQKFPFQLVLAKAMKTTEEEPNEGGILQ